MSNDCIYGIGFCTKGDTPGQCGCNKASAIKKPTPEGQHELYTGFDPLAPAAIKDRNGEVVLACCKKCGLGEIQLDENPVCRGYKAYPYYTAEDLLNQVLASDMAQREEDEGNKSELLNKIRKYLGK